MWISQALATQQAMRESLSSNNRVVIFLFPGRNGTSCLAAHALETRFVAGVGHTHRVTHSL
jgi:hypothetical protein